MSVFTRRDVLGFCSAGAATALAGVAYARPAALHAPAVEIAPGIFVFAGEHSLYTPANGGHIANVTLITGTAAAAVIDTGGSAGNGRMLLAAMRALTKLPIRYVINTHMHPDHVLGNAAFVADGTVFVGHAKLPRALAARGERYLEANRAALDPADFAGTTIVPPTLLVENTRTLDLGGRTLSLTARPTAHTDNDLTIRDETTGSLILGDLLFSGHVPTLDGSIKGWLSVLETLKGESAARAVPGHGPVSMAWPAGMEAEQAYLSAVVRDVRAAIKAGRPMEVASKTAAQDQRPNWLLFDDFNARNVSAAYAELEWD